MIRYLLLIPLFTLFSFFTPDHASGNTGLAPLDISFNLHGKVYDDSTGSPLVNHEVKITTDEGYSRIVLTNDDGNYGDTITGIVNFETLIHISTRDCNDQVHSQSVAAGTFAAIVNFAICGETEPPQGFNIGGLAFAGNFPINNPENTGDTGVARLYEVSTQGGMQLIQEKTFMQYGYYTFLDVLPGNYRINISLTQGSNHYHDFIPSWYQDELSWSKSELIEISDHDIFNLDISLTEKFTNTSGEGKIAGYVVIADRSVKSEDDVVAQGAVVILFTENELPLDFRMTDAAGNFEFAAIPAGKYKIYIDYPGKYSTYTDLEISETNPVIMNLKLELLAHDPNGIAEKEQGLSVGKIYPNPVSENAYLKLDLKNSMNLRFRIFDINGSEKYREDVMLSSGSVTRSFRTNGLSSGLYLLIISDADGKIISSARFVKE